METASKSLDQRNTDLNISDPNAIPATVIPGEVTLDIKKEKTIVNQSDKGIPEAKVETESSVPVIISCEGGHDIVTTDTTEYDHNMEDVNTSTEGNRHCVQNLNSFKASLPETDILNVTNSEQHFESSVVQNQGIENSDSVKPDGNDTKIQTNFQKACVDSEISFVTADITIDKNTEPVGEDKRDTQTLVLDYRSVDKDDSSLGVNTNNNAQSVNTMVETEDMSYKENNVVKTNESENYMNVTEPVENDMPFAIVDVRSIQTEHGSGENSSVDNENVLTSDNQNTIISGAYDVTKEKRKSVIECVETLPKPYQDNQMNDSSVMKAGTTCLNEISDGNVISEKDEGSESIESNFVIESVRSLSHERVIEDESLNTDSLENTHVNEICKETLYSAKNPIVHTNGNNLKKIYDEKEDGHNLKNSAHLSIRHTSSSKCDTGVSLDHVNADFIKNNQDIMCSGVDVQTDKTEFQQDVTLPQVSYDLPVIMPGSCLSLQAEAVSTPPEVTTLSSAAPAKAVTAITVKSASLSASQATASAAAEKLSSASRILPLASGAISLSSSAVSVPSSASLSAVSVTSSAVSVTSSAISVPSSAISVPSSAISVPSSAGLVASSAVSVASHLVSVTLSVPGPSLSYRVGTPVSVTSPSTSPGTDTGLPVISSIFSIKAEPQDYGLYGVMPTSNNTPVVTPTYTLTEGSVAGSNKASISTVIKRLHGKKVTPSQEEAKTAGVIKMTKLGSKNNNGNDNCKTYIKIPVTASSRPAQPRQQKMMIRPGVPGQKLPQIEYIYPEASAVKQLQTSTPQVQPTTVFVANTASNKIAGSGTSPQSPISVFVKNKSGQILPTKGGIYQTRMPVVPAVVVSTQYILPKGSPTFVGSKPQTTVNLSTSSVEGQTAKDINNKDVVKQGNELKDINTQTVGYSKIAQIISRVNPVPMYKPEPIPEHLKETVKTKTYQCYECGDTFYIEKSLMIHLNRCSMRLQYKCPKCRRQLAFTNKCQLLKHLRSHLNVPKTQGVPIHIKSDSIHIKSMYEEIGEGIDFKWYDEANCCDFKNENSCVVCQAEFKNEDERIAHYKRTTRPFSCDLCNTHLLNECSLAVHRNLHSCFQNGILMGELICPVCGLDITSDTDKFFEHLFNKCLHPYTQLKLNCEKFPNCKVCCRSKDEMRQHLMERLENYFKCSKCPMALKTLKSFMTHHNEVHGQMSLSDDIGSLVKIIYRCHQCDTLIDDRSFLMTHIEKHVNQCNQTGRFEYYCGLCTATVKSVELYNCHVHTMHNIVSFKSKTCRVCNQVFSEAIYMYLHYIKEHTPSIELNPVKFCDCGCVCKTDKMMQEHLCLNKLRFVSRHPLPEKVVDGRSQSKMYWCPLCKLAVCTVDKRVNHIQRHRSKQEFICVACDKINFTSMHNLRAHEVECLEKGMNWEKEQPSIREQQQHPRIQLLPPRLELKKNQCSICKVYVSSSNQLQNHYVLCHKKEFKNYHEYRSHEIAHAGKTKMELQNKKVKGAKKKVVSKGKSKSLSVKRKHEPISDVYISSDSETEEGSGLGKVRLSLKGVEREKRFIDKGEKFKCTKCNQEFTRKSKLEEHMDAEHGLHSCHLCGIMYESVSQLKVHLFISHKGKKPVYYCWVCRARKIERCFTEKSFLERHLSHKHRMKSWDPAKMVPELPESDKEGVSPEPQILECLKNVKGEMPVKKLKVEGEALFNCAKCSFTCESKAEFRQHIGEHNTENTVQCLECGLCFAVLPSLRRHLFMVHKVRDFDAYMEKNAIQQPKELDNLDYIEREEERIAETEETSSEEESENNLECRVCNTQFDTEHVLKQHMRVHGMAFIKKSRRRTASSRHTEADNEGEEVDVLSPGNSDEIPMKRARIESKLSSEDAEMKDVGESYSVIKNSVNGSETDVKNDLKLTFFKSVVSLNKMPT